MCEIWGAQGTGEGGSVPPPRRPPPPMAYAPRSSAQGIGGKEPDTVARRLHPGYGLPTWYRHARTAPPRRGRGRSAEGAGGVGAAGEVHGYPCEGAGGVPARSKMVGVWETGEGEQVPPPRQPLPPWRYPHGPQHGEILEKSRIRFPTGSIPDTAARLISPRTDPAPSRGRGRSAAGAGGVGVPEGYGYPCEGAGGVGVPEGYGYPCEGAGGVGAAGRSAWVSLRRRGWGEVTGERRTVPATKARQARRQRPDMAGRAQGGDGESRRYRPGAGILRARRSSRRLSWMDDRVTSPALCRRRARQKRSSCS